MTCKIGKERQTHNLRHVDDLLGGAALALGRIHDTDARCPPAFPGAMHPKRLIRMMTFALHVDFIWVGACDVAVSERSLFTSGFAANGSNALRITRHQHKREHLAHQSS